MQEGQRVTVTLLDGKSSFDAVLVEEHVEGCCWFVRKDDGSEWDVFVKCITVKEEAA